VYRKQSSRIEELERENKRLEKEVEEVGARFKKTEDQLEDLREANVDVAELRDQLRVAEEKVEGLEELVCSACLLCDRGGMC
jgi:archaellum component FlaC